MSDPNLKEQLSFQPELLEGPIPEYNQLLIGGMGGSALPARVLRFLEPSIKVDLWNNYRAPKVEEGVLAVSVSYSGETGETLSFAEEILSQGMPLAVVTDSDGALLGLAEKNSLPHVIVPKGLQPRDAFFYLLRGLLTVIGEGSLLDQIGKTKFDEKALTGSGKSLAEEFQDRIPLIYTSTEDAPLGYIWKILTNESAKIPAFCNVFPELAHNELESIVSTSAAGLKENFRILMIESNRAEKQLTKEMQVFEDLVSAQGVHLRKISLPSNKPERLVEGWATARVFAHALAKYYGANPDKVEGIESFKKML